MTIRSIAEAARTASWQLASTPTAVKNAALAAIEKELLAQSDKIVEANLADLEAAAKDDLAAPLLKRLRFDEESIRGVVEGVEALRKLPDPTGKAIAVTELDDDLVLTRESCPIGVIGVIFESRPDALVQISTLCLKSGNATLLKGGSEAANTNRILGDIIRDASVSAGLPEGWISLLETRADVAEMLALDDCIDLVIPRGSNEFVRHIMDTSRIPVMGHADGICHVYVDRAANVEMALEVVEDSKCQYLAVCNAAETLLVHNDIAAELLPLMAVRLKERGVELRGCPRTREIIECGAATEEDWGTEYLDAILAVRVVDSTSEAIDHINQYGSGHTDSIVTDDEAAAGLFLDMVDSGNVFWNASTRFADGFRYGLGAEVGISTSKLHARGPVGLEGLLIYKWKLRGQGHLVAPYAEGQRRFTHRPM